MVNCTDVVVENLHLSHFPGMMFIHNSQDVLVRNMTMVNRNNPEETGDIEFGGIGSHGEPWNSPWQYEVNLMRANNITMRDSFVTGGDDNGQSAPHPLSSTRSVVLNPCRWLSQSASRTTRCAPQPTTLPRPTNICCLTACAIRGQCAHRKRHVPERPWRFNRFHS